MLTLLTLAVRSRCDRGDVRKPMNSTMLRPANRFLLTLRTLLTLLFLSSRVGGREGREGTGYTLQGKRGSSRPNATPLKM